MPNQTIPITLVAGVPPPDAQWTTLAQLLVFVQNYMAGSIRADISFVPQVVNDPAAFDTPLIFNTTQQVFKGWSTALGRYVAITNFTVGDVKNSFVGTDDLAHGWVILNGRAIAAITGISGTQQAALTTLFPSGTMPTITPANINGLPPNGSFGNIPYPPSLDPVLTPANGVIEGLPFTNPPTGAECEALRDQTEVLRDSAQALEDVVAAIQAQAEFLLNALHNSAGPPLYAAVFCGYP